MLLSPDARKHIHAAIAPSVQAIHAHKKAIEAQLRAAGIMEEGDTLKITMGVELEHTAVFGERTALRRIGVLNALGIDQPTDSKDASWMPPSASKDWVTRDLLVPSLPYARAHTRYDVEPTFGPSIGSKIERDGSNTLEAYAPREIISYPLSTPEAAINWLVAAPPRMLKEAGKYGIRALDFSTRASDAAPPNSVHLHMAVIVHKKDGHEINILKAEDMGIHTPHANQRPSDAGIAVAHRLNQLQHHEMLPFAPAAKSTDRFSHSSGPKQIGFMPRKVIDNKASAMFRGEGIHAYREEAPYDMPDVGDFRIELRIPSAEIIGHPNKEAYPETALFPALAIEQYVRAVREGIDTWVQEEPSPSTYNERLQALYHERFPLPKSQLEAYQQFAKSESAKAYFGDRHAHVLEAVSMLNHAYETEPRTVTSIAPPLTR